MGYAGVQQVAGCAGQVCDGLAARKSDEQLGIRWTPRTGGARLQGYSLPARHTFGHGEDPMQPQGLAVEQAEHPDVGRH